jgi:TonB family protein
MTTPSNNGLELTKPARAMELRSSTRGGRERERFMRGVRNILLAGGSASLIACASSLELRVCATHMCAAEIRAAGKLRGATHYIQMLGTRSVRACRRQAVALAAPLTLSVRLRRDGSVDAIDVLRSSGTLERDQALVQCLWAAAPFPTVPEELPDLQLELTWTPLS